MQVILTCQEMQGWAERARARSKRVVLVPTMGFLHEGHLALMRAGRALGERLVVSIFVNPLQFGPGEDYPSYPRDLDRDLSLAAAEGVDVVFSPPVEELFSGGPQFQVKVGDLSTRLCGRGRPGHFDGVCTVVAKLFNLAQPRFAMFGQKDYQQLLIIRRMAADLNFPVEVVAVPTVREKDGLALSSRNSYLNEPERRQAVCLYEGLLIAKGMFAEGERDPLVVTRKVTEHLACYDLVTVDYVSICHGETLAEVERIEPGMVIALAVFIGKARLIDNYCFGEEL